MQKIFIPVLFILFVAFGISCKKNEGCTSKSVDSERAAIQAFATSRGINAIAAPSGIYYEIINPGSGPTPTASSNISVLYEGALTDGTVFDSRLTSPITFPLINAIAGWQLGLPLIKKGGVIKLIIPSSLGYGCQGYGSIPPDAILYFEISLVDVI